MKESIKIKAIELYDEMIFEQNKKLKLIDELKKLGIPQSFIEKHTSQVLSNEEIISEVMLSIYDNEAFDQNIYVFLGGYVKLSNGKKDTLVNDYKKSDYCLFLNIENEYDFKIIEKKNINEFKKNNYIIMLPELNSIKVYKKIYYEIQNYYYKELLFNRKKELDIYKELIKKYRR